MPDHDHSRPEPGRPDNPRRPGDPAEPAGLDPTRDPQKPGVPAGPRDTRTTPPSSIADGDGPGVTPSPGGPPGRGSSGDEPM